MAINKVTFVIDHENSRVGFDESTESLGISDALGIIALLVSLLEENDVKLEEVCEMVGNLIKASPNETNESEKKEESE